MFHGVPWCLMMSDGVSRCLMVCLDVVSWLSYDVSCCLMSHRVSWCLMLSYDVSWSFMVSHSVLGCLMES